MLTTTPRLTAEQRQALHRAEQYVSGHPDIAIRECVRDGRMSLEIRYAGTAVEPEDGIFARLNAATDMADEWVWPWPGFYDDGKFGITFDGIELWTWAR